MDSRSLAARIQHEIGSTGGRESVARSGPPPRVADYELVRRIGAGSYGEVWLARSIIGQWRAVKVISRATFTSERPYEREFRGILQFEPISRSHAGLIHVLHVGRAESNEWFYYVMELADSRREPAGVAGGGTAGDGGAGPETPPVNSPDFSPDDYRPHTLASELKRRGRLPVAEAVALGIQLTDALGHIHRHGLVHRDVKPSNVIFVQGQPKLADLGLVAATKEARSFVGTEGFIPPEGPGSVKADFFALGRLLYEAATGKDRCEFPELPEDLDTYPDRAALLELNEVLSRLCAPDPAERYANAAEVAGDLNLVLAGRSVRQAYGVERRWRRATQIFAAALGIAVLATGIVWVQGMRRDEAEARASQERSLRERAESAERESQQQLYTALLEQARATVRSGELGQRVRALEAVRRAATFTNTAELRCEAIAALALPDLRFERSLPFPSEFTARRLDPWFQRAAVCRGTGPVEIRDAANDRLIATLPPSTQRMCYNIHWSPDGRFLAAKRDYDGLGQQADWEVWDVRGDPRRVLLIRDVYWNAVSYDPGKPRLVTGAHDGRIVTWDLEHGVELSRRAFFDGVPERLVLSPEGKRLAVFSVRGGAFVVAIFDAQESTLVSSRVFPARVSSLDWHPAGRSLAVTDLKGTVHLMDANTGTTQVLGRHRAEAATVAFDPRGDYLITGGWERSLTCWDCRTLQRAFVMDLDSYELQFSADGGRCATWNAGGVQIHALERPVQREFAEDLGPRLRFAAFSQDGRWLAASADESLGVWDLLHHGPGMLIPEGSETEPFWTPAGSELFASREDGCFRWRIIPAAHPDSPPALEPGELKAPPGYTWLTVASNYAVWTTGRGSQVVGLSRLATEATGWSPTASGINSVSPDGRWLAIHGSYSPLLHVYRLPELALVAVLTNQAGIAGFQFSASGQELAVASRGQVEFWDVARWQRSRVLTNFAGIPHVGVLAQPDGRGWWLAKEPRFACLYDADSLKPQLPLPGGMSPLALTADGRFLAVSSEARRLQVWDLMEVRHRLRDLGLDWETAPHLRNHPTVESRGAVAPPTSESTASTR